MSLGCLLSAYDIMPQCPSEKAILQGAQYEGIWTHDLLLAWLDSQRGFTEPQELQLLLASTKVWISVWSS